MRGDTDGLNTKTSVSSHKYPPVRVIANTQLCVMSRVWGRVSVCGVSEGRNEGTRECRGVGGNGDGGGGGGGERVLVVVQYYDPYLRLVPSQPARNFQ